MFIFDVFEFSERMGALECIREQEFSPLKNGPESTVDSPSTCIKHMSELHKKWIMDAGGIIANGVNGPCEISPLISYFGENLESWVQGKTITLPFYLEQ